MNIEAFFKVTYGLYIISAKAGDKLNGYIANTAFQVTAEPPQIAISCNKDNLTCQLIKESGQFSISVLNQNVKPEIINLFGYQSGKEINKFEPTGFINSKAGTPVVVEDAIAWFDCRVNQTLDVGTHLVFIAEIIENDLLNGDADPLTYAWYRDVKKGAAPRNAPTYIDKSQLNKETISQEESNDGKYKCMICGHIYDPATGDPENGIPPGTLFEALPDDWTCPACGAPKSAFEPM